MCRLRTGSFHALKNILLFSFVVLDYLVKVIPPMNTRSLFRDTLLAFSLVSRAFASPSNLMTRETPPLSSILDRAVIYCVHVQTRHAYPLCMRATSPVVCLGCTRHSEGCCCCKTPFRPLELQVRQATHLASHIPLRFTPITPGMVSGSAGAAVSFDRLRCAAVRRTRCDPGTT